MLSLPPTLDTHDLRPTRMMINNQPKVTQNLFYNYVERKHMQFSDPDIPVLPINGYRQHHTPRETHKSIDLTNE